MQPGGLALGQQRTPDRSREKELQVGGLPRGSGRGAPEVEPVPQRDNGENIRTGEERPQLERTQSARQEKQDERHITVKFKNIRAKDRHTKAPDRARGDLPQRTSLRPRWQHQAANREAGFMKVEGKTLNLKIYTRPSCDPSVKAQVRCRKIS